MKAQQKALVKEYLHKQFKKAKQDLQLTQQQLADLLELDIRSCNNLTAGRSLPSTITFILFLNRCCSDPEKILKEIFEILTNTKPEATVPSSKK